MSYALPNPFDENAAPVFSAPQHAERLPQGDQAEAGAAYRLPGLQISAAGHMLDVVTFMAELMCDRNYRRTA